MEELRMRAGHGVLVLRDLDRLFRRGVAPTGDGALLDRFLAEGDESAFEALVNRHGPMVLGVCRRVLPSAHDADDAFQATFLVLARKAAWLRDPDRLGPWLYGVAMRVATKARTRAARRRYEPLGDCPARERAGTEWSDVMPVLDAELQRLPAKHRDVLVLCLLEGASAEEAAHRLGCPVGTVKSRLARGRQSLRDRLVVRGIAPAAVITALSARDALAAPVSQNLLRAALEAITTSAVAPGVAALTRGVTPAMYSKSIMTASLLAGGIALAGIGTVAWMNPTSAQEPGAPGQVQGRAQAAARAQQTNNMKQIALAFHNFASTADRFPASAIYGTDGQPKLSWRVAILPYLEQQALYQQFHLDEPWDSPHNKALIGRMPAVYETPYYPAPAGETRFRGFGGKGALFEGSQGVRIADITDGTSNTVMITAAAESTPWTKPGELPFTLGQPLQGLTDRNTREFPIGLTDGSVKWLPAGAVNFLPFLITRAGGEVVDWSVVQPEQGPAPAAAPAGAAGATPPLAPTAPVPTSVTSAPPQAFVGGPPGPTAPPQAIEQRLQRVEEKLDLVLRKLDLALPQPQPQPGAGGTSAAARP